jgi:hypothetical protein
MLKGAFFAAASGVLCACAAHHKVVNIASAPITKQEVAKATAPPSADQCNASRYQSLIGMPRTAIPAHLDAPATRIACTMCAITMEYAPGRLNIFYSENTGLVEKVRCG